jgi:predicted CopG family antitoxin
VFVIRHVGGDDPEMIVADPEHSMIRVVTLTTVVKGLCMISAYQDSMSVTENIPVSEETYNQILDLRRPDETLNDTLARLVEKVKKQRLTDDIEEVMARDEFVELDL